MQAGTPCCAYIAWTRVWILASVAILAIVDAVQRGNFGFPARVCIGAAFCVGFLAMAAAGDSIISRSQGIFEI